MNDFTKQWQSEIESKLLKMKQMYKDYQTKKFF